MRQDKTRQDNTTQARQQTEHIKTPRQHNTPCGVCLKLSIRELKRQYKKTIQKDNTKRQYKKTIQKDNTKRQYKKTIQKDNTKRQYKMDDFSFVTVFFVLFF